MSSSQLMIGIECQYLGDDIWKDENLCNSLIWLLKWLESYHMFLLWQLCELSRSHWEFWMVQLNNTKDDDYDESQKR
jgi:hypothetical protein